MVFNIEENLMEQVDSEHKLKQSDCIDDKSNNKEAICYCPRCRSKNVYGVSRVVGYFSVIENWNKSKRAELKRRQKGNYWYEEEE